MKTMKVPQAQRSIYGPNGLDQRYIAKKVMGEEGFREAENMAKDPTCIADFELYSVHEPPGKTRVYSFDFLRNSHVSVKLKRLGVEMSWHEFETLQVEVLTESRRAGFATLDPRVEVAYKLVSQIEDLILSRPVDDPFADEMMDEI